MRKPHTSTSQARWRARGGGGEERADEEEKKPYVDEVGVVARTKGAQDTLVADIVQQDQIVHSMLKRLRWHGVRNRGRARGEIQLIRGERRPKRA
jgi:hypothetical protein